jgi:hypothetical protein
LPNRSEIDNKHGNVFHTQDKIASRPGHFYEIKGELMTHAKFEKISPSDKSLYGSRRLLLCGFSAKTQSKFMTLLKMVGLETTPTVWATSEQDDTRLYDLMELSDETGRGISSDLPRAVIVSGITEKELHRLMAVCRKSGMQQALWATLTPTSETWTLKHLLAELSAERRAFQKD